MHPGHKAVLIVAPPDVTERVAFEVVEEQEIMW